MIYTIRKTLNAANGKKQHVYINNGHSEVWETKSEKTAIEFCALLNENSDSGHTYVVVAVGKIIK